MSIGTGFKTPLAGTRTLVVLPNKVIEAEGASIFNLKKIYIQSGTNIGEWAYVNNYTEENPSYENYPTVTLDRELPAAVESGVQFVISPFIGERALQGEGRPDFAGVQFTNSSGYRVPVISKKVLSRTPNEEGFIGYSNEVMLHSIIDEGTLVGGDTIRINEMGLTNTPDVAISPEAMSGVTIARVALSDPIDKEPLDRIHLFWKLRFGTSREPSV